MKITIPEKQFRYSRTYGGSQLDWWARPTHMKIKPSPFPGSNPLRIGMNSEASWTPVYADMC